MICPKCGNNNVAEARFCAVCGTPMPQGTPASEGGCGQPAYAYPAQAPVNALPARRRDISASNYVMMILNAVFTFLAMVMLFIPYRWEKVTTSGLRSSGSKKKYFSIFTNLTKRLTDKTYSDDKSFYVLMMVFFIIFLVIAVAGIVFAFLRFRFSAGLLAAAGTFAVAQLVNPYLNYTYELMYYAQNPKRAQYKTDAYTILSPTALTVAVVAVVFSAVVYATYRKKKASA